MVQSDFIAAKKTVAPSCVSLTVEVVKPQTVRVWLM